LQDTTLGSAVGVPSLTSCFPESLMLVVCAADGERCVPLRANAELVIGRHASCQLSLPNPKLSRFHARFKRRENGLCVEDLGSRHGTWLFGKRIDSAELVLGSVVQLADITVAITCGPDLTLAPAAAARHGAGASGLYISTRLSKLRELLRRAARTPLPVVLLGETGTGKELAAREIHHASGRSGPLRAVNCAAIAPQLVESTLFGHERGAFTGAERARSGVFEDANGGTLFLDEVGELSPATQGALLRVLETARLTRIGSNRELTVDVRVVCATHRDLHAMSLRGQFRADLLHRLSVITITLPPLRERREEISPLVRHFLAQVHGAREIDPRALTLLEGYDWPGNIRELRNVIYAAAALAGGPCITPDDLPASVRASATAHAPAMSAAAPPGAALALRVQLRRIETEKVRHALAQTQGNQRRAAALIGLPLRTFERRVRELRDEEV
jgi:DNA-binding NtrC family response regulator